MAPHSLLPSTSLTALPIQSQFTAIPQPIEHVGSIHSINTNSWLSSVDASVAVASSNPTAGPSWIHVDHIPNESEGISALTSNPAPAPTEPFEALAGDITALAGDMTTIAEAKRLGVVAESDAEAQAHRDGNPDVDTKIAQAVATMRSKAAATIQRFCTGVAVMASAQLRLGEDPALVQSQYSAIINIASHVVDQYEAVARDQFAMYKAKHFVGTAKADLDRLEEAGSEDEAALQAARDAYSKASEELAVREHEAAESARTYDNSMARMHDAYEVFRYKPVKEGSVEMAMGKDVEQ